MGLRFKVSDDEIYDKLFEKFNCLILRNFDPDQGNFEDLLKSQGDTKKIIVFGNQAWTNINKRDCYAYGTKVFMLVQQEQTDTIDNFVNGVIEVLWDLDFDIESATFGRAEDTGGVSLEACEIVAGSPMVKEGQ